MDARARHLALAAALSVAAAGCRMPGNTAVMLAKAREASGYAKDHRAWKLKVDGSIPMFGWFSETILVQDAKFRRTVNHDSTARGSDGIVTWQKNEGFAHTMVAESGEAEELSMAVVSGAWASAPNRYEVHIQEEKPSVITCSLRKIGGLIQSELDLDPKTMLPVELRICGQIDSQMYDFSEYKPFGVRKFPTEILRSLGYYDMETCKLISAVATGSPQDVFTPPPADTRKMAFGGAPAGPLALDMSGGSVAITPAVDGSEIGPFVIDLRDPSLVIGTDEFDALGKLQPIPSPGKSVHLKSLRFGEVRFKAPAAKLSVNPKGQGHGKSVVGYDILNSAILDLRPREKQAYVYSPEKDLGLAESDWIPIAFERNMPVIKATFKGRSGNFWLSFSDSRALVFDDKSAYYRSASFSFPPPIARPTFIGRGGRTGRVVLGGSVIYTMSSPGIYSTTGGGTPAGPAPFLDPLGTGYAYGMSYSFGGRVASEIAGRREEVLPELKLGNMSIRNVHALHPGLDSSDYYSGYGYGYMYGYGMGTMSGGSQFLGRIGLGLLSHYRVILDYPHNRMALLEDK